MKTICIYHGNCADGFGAAWALREALVMTPKIKPADITFYAAKYQEDPPDVLGCEVYIVDFSYKKPVLVEMAEAAHHITIIDHHKTALEDLVDLPANVRAIFNMGHSGAMLVWKYFYGHREPPQLLKHIEDRDLWKFALPGTREIQAALFSYPYDFAVWDELMAEPVENLRIEGVAIERKHHKDIHELLLSTKRNLRIGGVVVPAANLPYTMSSDAGNLMVEGQPFAACYTDTKEGRVFSLRSKKDGLDVSNIAKLYGGGGHRNAAGFKVSLEEARAFEI